MRSFMDRLMEMGLLRSRVPRVAKLNKARPEDVPLLLCEAGELVGGLSVALDVRPDEAIGALCTAIGGGARALKVVDVRDQPELELVVEQDGVKERWSVPDVPALAHNLNDLYREDAQAKVVAVLGEWQDALQLWCLPKAAVPKLLRERFFRARNAEQLEALAEGAARA